MLSSNDDASFFVKFLTLRQKMAPRAVLGLGFASMGVVSAIWFFWPPAIAGNEQADATGGLDQSRLRIVSVGKLETAGPEFLSQRYTGIVTARRLSRLAAKSVGLVEEVAVEIGDEVSKGQILLRLDSEQLAAQLAVEQANLDAAQAQLDEFLQGPRKQDIARARATVNELKATLRLNESNFKRLQLLRDSDAISKQEFDESQFSLEAMQARVVSAEKELERLEEGTRKEQIVAQRAVVAGLQARMRRIEADLADRQIEAPYDGLIQSRLIDEGSVVSPGQTVLELFESAPYEIRVGLPPDVAKELTNSQLLVTLDEQKLAATIDRLAPAINDSTRTREAILQLSETSSELVNLGSAVAVYVQRPVESAGFWVPTECLTSGPRGLWALLVAIPSESENGSVGQEVHRVERRQVELLRAHGDWSEIRGPISAEEQIIFEGIHVVTPGQQVLVSDQKAATRLASSQ